MDSARNGHNWIRNFIACDSPVHTHKRTYSHTGFLTAFRSAALELLGPVFLWGILVHLALEKLFVHFQEENWENFCLPCMALHLTKAECVCVRVSRFSSSQCTLLSNFDYSFLSLSLGLPISFFLMKRMKVSHKETEKIVFWLRCALLLDSFALSL